MFKIPETELNIAYQFFKISIFICSISKVQSTSIIVPVRYAAYGWGTDCAMTQTTTYKRDVKCSGSDFKQPPCWISPLN